MVTHPELQGGQGVLGIQGDQQLQALLEDLTFPSCLCDPSCQVFRGPQELQGHQRGLCRP